MNQVIKVGLKVNVTSSSQRVSQISLVIKSVKARKLVVIQNSESFEKHFVLTI